MSTMTDELCWESSLFLPGVRDRYELSRQVARRLFRHLGVVAQRCTLRSRGCKVWRGGDDHVRALQSVLAAVGAVIHTDIHNVRRRSEIDLPPCR